METSTSDPEYRYLLTYKKNSLYYNHKNRKNFKLF